MPWFIYLDSGVAVDESEADDEAEAVQAAISKIREWLDRAEASDDPSVELGWLIEYEED